MGAPELKSFMYSFILGILVMTLLAQSTGAADWPQWRGPDRTGHVPEGEAVPVTIPAEPKTLWRIKIGDGFASPVVAGGKVFYFDNQAGQETLHALDAAKGNELWRTNIDKAFTDQQGPSGPRCTPMADGDRIYAQSCQGELRCVRMTDGGLLWRTNFKDFGAVFIGEKGNAQGASRHGNNGSPIIDGAALFAQVGSTNGASVVAFDKMTGQVLWKSQNDQAAYAAPIIATIAGVKQLVSFTTDGVIGLALKDGRLLWRVPVHTTFARHVTTPVVFGDMVVVSSHEIGLIGIKVTGDAAGCRAEQMWVRKESAINFSSPVVDGQYLYGLGPEKNLICVDLKTGKQAWSKEGYISAAGTRAFAAFVVMDKNILALTDGGNLVLFAAEPREFKELGRAQVCGKTWCNPAYADGNLFLRDARELLCVCLLP